MKPTILNREFKHPADGWYHIEPMGEHPNSAGGVVQIVDKEACESIVNRFNTAADAGSLIHGHEMLIDHEHFSHDAEKETRAFGWLTRLQNRDNGIYGQIRWTSTGKSAVDGGDYRFFSTEYDPGTVAIVKNTASSARKVRPLELAGLTLTNRPNNKGGKPITNRDGLAEPSARPAQTASAARTSTTGEQVDIQNQKTMKQIASRLGLSADASEEAVLGELTKIINRATTAEAALLPLTQERDLLKNRVSTIEDQQAEADLTAHGIKADDADRASLKAGLLHNRESGLAFLKRMSKTGSVEKKPLTNRAGAKNPGETREESGADEAAKANKIKNRAHELKGNSNRSFSDCWAQASQEINAPQN